MNARRVSTSFILVASIFVLGACRPGGSGEEGENAGGGATSEPGTEAPAAEPADLRTRALAVFEPLPATVDDVNPTLAALGSRLYHDPGLSGDGTVSCATCHNISEGGDDNAAVSTGIAGQHGPIGAPTVLNSRYNFVQFWDGRAGTLEEQAAGPVTNTLEMGANWDQVLAYLNGDATYPTEFQQAFGEAGISQDAVTTAIAEFERTLVTPAPFDRYLEGDDDAIDAHAREGLETFLALGCQACHTGINIGGSMYQRLGAVGDYFGDRGTELTDADMGRFNVTGEEADRHRFKVPTLRNITLTAPYFHDGTQQTLEQAVTSMARYQLGRELEADDVSALIAFLRSLEGQLPESSK